MQCCHGSEDEVKIQAVNLSLCLHDNLHQKVGVLTSVKADAYYLQNVLHWQVGQRQGGVTCGAIDEPRKSSKAIDKRVIIDFRDKNVVIARFRDINEVFI